MVVLTCFVICWCVYVCYVLCGCFDNCVSVLVVCVLVFIVFCIVSIVFDCTVFLYCFFYVHFIRICFVCTSVRTAATE
jgi:hypothetical protein